MEIYISREGKRFGPLSLAEIQADIDAGKIQRTDLAWHQGAERWFDIWKLEGIKFPKRHLPPPLPPSPPPLPINAIQNQQIPQKSSSGGEMVILILLTFCLPIIGIIIGLMRIAGEEKRNEGFILLLIAIVLMILYAIALLHS